MLNKQESGIVENARNYSTVILYHSMFHINFIHFKYKYSKCSLYVLIKKIIIIKSSTQPGIRLYINISLYTCTYGSPILRHLRISKYQTFHLE
jgi:hypothetical protein